MQGKVAESMVLPSSNITIILVVAQSFTVFRLIFFALPNFIDFHADLPNGELIKASLVEVNLVPSMRL
jgi:hypothetical protein